MNIRPKHRAPAFTILEMLVYIALFALVIGAATRTFYECWDRSKLLRQNADDITRALDAGERWRADLRAATAPLQLTSTPNSEECRISTKDGTVTYFYADSQLHRQSPTTGKTLWLSNIKSSQMQPDPRGRVPAWRWELELKSTRREVRLRPLFTFEGVPGAASVP